MCHMGALQMFIQLSFIRMTVAYKIGLLIGRCSLQPHRYYIYSQRQSTWCVWCCSVSDRRAAAAECGFARRSKYRCRPVRSCRVASAWWFGRRCGSCAGSRMSCTASDKRLYIMSCKDLHKGALYISGPFRFLYIIVKINTDVVFCETYSACTRALNDLFFLIFIKMFILKFQASNSEKLLQANLQSPTRIKISRNQRCMRLFLHRFVYRD